MNLIKNALRFGYRRFPSRLRYGLDLSYLAISDTIKNMAMPAYLVSGHIRTSTGESSKASFIYLGALPQHKVWCAGIFIDSSSPEPIGRLSLLDIMMRRRGLATADLVLSPINPLSKALLAKYGWLVVPKYVTCTIDLTRPIEQLIDRAIVRDVERVQRRMNFRIDTLREDAAFDEFYDDMLVPTVRKRHEENAFLSSREDLREVFRRGYLRAAYQGDQWIAAELVVQGTAKSLRTANIGWRGGSEEILKSRVVSVLMHDLIVWAKKEGFEELDSGSTYPFVNNGILDFKIKWGARPGLPPIGSRNGEPIGHDSYLGAYFNTSSAAGRSILQNFPVFEKRNNEMCIAGWGSTPSPEATRHLDRGMAWHDLSLPLHGSEPRNA